MDFNGIRRLLLCVYRIEEIQLTYHGCPRLCDMRRVEMMVDIETCIHMYAFFKYLLSQEAFSFFLLYGRDKQV